MAEPEKQYLGDAVYAEWEADVITLTAGVTAIYLEPEVFQALERFVRSGENENS